jgi:hypothetical protein
MAHRGARWDAQVPSTVTVGNQRQPDAQKRRIHCSQEAQRQQTQQEVAVREKAVHLLAGSRLCGASGCLPDMDVLS